jgi:hypothetical protein
MKCPYCGGRASVKDSRVIYGVSYGNAWICENFPKCDAYVGTHKGTNKPLGRIANKELRELKKRCHELFDPLWKNGKMSRSGAYMALQRVMGLSGRRAHIGKFDENECRKLIELVKGGAFMEFMAK